MLCNKINTLLVLQLMEEFKRAHQKMFNSAQQKTQSLDQVPEKVKKANCQISCILLKFRKFRSISKKREREREI